jgi:hypothetical protein
MNCETVCIAKAGPPPGSLAFSPIAHAVLMRLYPAPGMLTHISRGIDNMPAVFVTGSTVRTMIVSVQVGQPSLSSPRKPKKAMLTRLAPSHWAFHSGADNSKEILLLDRAARQIRGWLV